MAIKPGIYWHLDGFDGFDKRIDFDKRKIRAGMRRAGAIVRGCARADLASGTSSGAGYPAVRKGNLRRSIRVKVSRSGFLVRVAPYKTPAMGAHFYPAYLHYGVRAKASSHHSAPGGWRIEPRENFMADALQESAGQVEAVLRAAFESAFAIR